MIHDVMSFFRQRFRTEGYIIQLKLTLPEGWTDSKTLILPLIELFCLSLFLKPLGE